MLLAKLSILWMGIRAFADFAPHLFGVQIATQENRLDGFAKFREGFVSRMLVLCPFTHLVGNLHQ
jgi:hypothetical protein